MTRMKKKNILNLTQLFVVFRGLYPIAASTKLCISIINSEISFENSFEFFGTEYFD